MTRLWLGSLKPWKKVSEVSRRREVRIPGLNIEAPGRGEEEGSWWKRRVRVEGSEIL